jgi:hypothetical protein
MNWDKRNIVLKAALLLRLVASMAMFVLLIAISIRALLQADANGFMLMAFLTSLALVGVVAAWKQNPVLMLFSSLFLLPYGLYTSWGFESIFGLVGPFIVLFVLSSFLILGAKKPESPV